MSEAVPGFDLSDEEKAPIIGAMASVSKAFFPNMGDVALSAALAGIGNALLANLTADQCDRLALAKRQNIQ